MTTPPRDPRHDGSLDSDRRLDFDERRSNDRREADQLRMGWMHATQADIRYLKDHFDEIVRNQLDERQRLTAVESRLLNQAEVVGVDDRGRLVKGGMADTYIRLAGAKTGLFWIIGFAVAAMGIYSTFREAAGRWFGH